MSWFYETRTRPSEKNGIIVARRLLGNWEIKVDGCGETTPGLRSMWEDAFEKTKLHTGYPKVTRVLMLGLGGGGEISTIRRYFPGSTLTAIEIDPEMVKLAKELKIYWPAPFPKVICEDAGTAVPRLAEEFDLIIVDMFKGPNPSALSQDPAFQNALNKHLARGGLLLANVYKHEQLLDELAKGLYLVKKWRFATNHLGLYGKQEIVESLKEGYRPVREWPDFDPIPSMKALSPARLTGEPPGIYWRFGPFSFEKYVGDAEPNIGPLPKHLQRPIRVIMWQRLKAAERPRGWISFSEGPSHTYPILRLHPEYYKEWDESAKRGRRKWRTSLLETSYRMETVSYEEFVEAYVQSTLPLDIKHTMPHDIRMRMKNPHTPVSFLVARRIKDGKIVAGIARMRSRALPISFYVAGFYLRDVRHHPLMVGLLDRWCQDALKEGIRFIDLGYVWRHNRDFSWKGLSLFKSKFNPLYFFYPSILYRYIWNIGTVQKS